MKHALASESSVAWTIHQKYGNALPLYRQEKDWEQYGIELSRTTLANWIIYCSKHYFDPLYQFFHRKLLERNFLMADETPVQVLNKPGRRAESKSYMWVCRTGEDGLPPIIMYGYSETRVGENAIRPFTVGRKNWLFSDSPAGETASATVYSIVEMAKAHELNIYKYIKYILGQRPSKDWSDEQLETIVPWNQDVIGKCKR